MFDLLFHNKKNEFQSYMDIISVNIKKLSIAKMAVEKAVNMIAHAVAKSEFVVQRANGRVKDNIYWKLNIQPNPKQTGTDFWIEVVQKLLTEEEAVICRVGKNFYLAESFQETGGMVLPLYKNIAFRINDETVVTNQTISGSNVIHLRAKNKKIRQYMENVIQMLNETIDAMNAAKKIESTPKFALNVEGSIPTIMSKNPDGTDKKLTIDDYKDSIKQLMESENIEILINQKGLKTEQMKIETKVTSEDIVKYTKEIMTDCAFAFDIPRAVFLGEITEKADSTNEFITYAVSWIIEIIEDSLNAKLVGEKDFIEGEYIWIDITNFKHVDVIESANNLDKLRAIGFSFDEILKMIGYAELNTEFSKERVITKNYTNNLGGDEG